MKKVIPFKKDIIFDTNIGEINSISLEHEIKAVENNTITGYFVVSGDYRITEASLNVDPFEYKLPFDISIDDRYDTKDVKVDIDNFYYEVSNNRVLGVNIELAVENLEEKKVPEVREEIEVEKVEERETVEEVKEEVKEEVVEEVAEEIKEKRCVEPETSLFSSNESEGYKTYKVYLVRETDTIESITETYNVTREALEMYNDLSNIKLGDKLIIPSV